ncbi:hypothetical protein G7K71_02420 [Desulfofundulus sp. TPOSR]|uniref:helix-turn-helix domain-containing protein n=1 Tax=Desulfofundulus sp. TPOSR TaxID=2714340 RepID=UPI0014082EA4|nr:helix-turn-helix domain-containing protein [Desulfofundulus sp. TPOSR]NHM25883.1 hypothetical protein [Desulfofundulus sp. TPOSR]
MGTIREHTLTVKGCTVIASEWLSWRKQGLSNTEIAAMLGVSPSMARVIARKFREAGMPDLQYRKRKPGPVKILDTATDIGAYVLGVLWGTASTSGEGYWVRHRDSWYVNVVRKYLGVTAEGHESYSRTGNQWRLKITRAADVAAVRNLLERHGWAPRKAPERPYPCGNIDDRGFVRAWVELHSSADVARTGKKRMPTPRLRVYGSQPLLEEMNRVIAVGAGWLPRKLHLIATVTGETWCLCYTGGSFRAVVDWLYAGAGLYNPAVRERLGDLTLFVSRLRKPT